MKLLFALSLLVLAAAVFGQGRSGYESYDRLQSYGTGVVLVPIDRVALTVTATGLGSTATDAVNAAEGLQTNINNTLSTYNIIDVRNGGVYLEPVYSGSGLSFSAHTSLSIVVNSADFPAIIDSMVALGASNLSFVSIPDFFAVEEAQRQSLQLAVADAIFKAQAVFDMIDHCAYNISDISIKNPALELPTLTFNIYANMGNNRNYFGNGLRENGMGSANLNRDHDREGNNRLNNENARPMLLGAGAPLIEGDREEVVAYVELWISHTACSVQGSGMVQDLTAILDLSNVVGIAGGSFAIPSSSPTGSAMPTRPVRSTMW